MFLPYLEKLVDYNKRFINYWGYKEHKYNTLLDHHEPGMTVKTLDEVFGQLRQSIVPLVKEVAQSQSKPETDFLYATFPKEKQKEFTIQILNQMGYDFEAGRLDDTVHPFATGINLEITASQRDMTKMIFAWQYSVRFMKVGTRFMNKISLKS